MSKKNDAATALLIVGVSILVLLIAGILGFLGSLAAH